MRTVTGWLIGSIVGIGLAVIIVAALHTDDQLLAGLIGFVGGSGGSMIGIYLAEN